MIYLMTLCKNSISFFIILNINIFYTHICLYVQALLYVMGTNIDLFSNICVTMLIMYSNKVIFSS